MSLNCICEDCIEHISNIADGNFFKMNRYCGNDCIIATITTKDYKESVLIIYISSVYKNIIPEDLYLLRITFPINKSIVLDKLNQIVKKIDYSELLG